MSVQIIGRVKSPSGKSFEVKWDANAKIAYVSWGGWKHLGKAYSASEAMRKAEAFLYNK